MFKVDGPLAKAFDEEPLNAMPSSDRKLLQIEVASFIVEDIVLSLLRHVPKDDVKKLLACKILESTAEFADCIGQATCVIVCCVTHCEHITMRARLPLCCTHLI